MPERFESFKKTIPGFHKKVEHAGQDTVFSELLISDGTLIPVYGIAAAPEEKDSGFIVVASAPAADFIHPYEQAALP